MTPQEIQQAADALAAARRGQAIPELPQALRPQSRDDAFAIQDAVTAKLGEKPGGWKVGALPDGSAFVAPIFASSVKPSPAAMPARGFKVIGIECEIGFRLNKALPARPQPYTRDEVVAAAAMHPTIEIVDSRYADFQSLDRLQVLADNFSNGGLVYGAAASGWEGADLSHPPIAVTADGKPFADRTGLRAGNPVNLLVTAVNEVRQRGGMAAGTFVTTGTHTGMVFTEPGVTIRADYGRFGTVEVSFPV